MAETPVGGFVAALARRYSPTPTGETPTRHSQTCCCGQFYFGGDVSLSGDNNTVSSGPQGTSFGFG